MKKRIFLDDFIRMQVPTADKWSVGYPSGEAVTAQDCSATALLRSGQPPPFISLGE